jgi:5-hydroxyisourate hydrolase-like protein (transthyretin family)
MNKLFKLILGTDWITSCLLLVLLTSCKALQEKNTVVTGFVFDQSTEKPVSGLEVNLRREWESMEPFGPVYGELIQTTTTNTKGEFSFNLALSARPHYSYKVEVNTEGLPYAHHHWQDGDFLASTLESNVDVGKAQHMNMPLVAIGELDITATNHHPTDSLLFELTSSIKGYVRTCYYRKLGPGESYHLDIYDWVPQGDVEFTWKVSGDQVDSTIHFQRAIEANMNYIELTFEG